MNLLAEEAGLLRGPPGTAVLLIRRTAFSGERRVSYVNSWVRSDRFRFQASFVP